VDEKIPIAPRLTTLLAHGERGTAQLRAAMHAVLRGEHDEAATAAWLIALRMKGETAGEIATAAQVLREHMLAWDPGLPGVLDTCGTGGDGAGTFNISTATAVVAAAAGAPVVKHGNRAASSRSGSADVLAALGVCVEGDAARARRCLDRAGLAFCFAPQFHPALRHVAALRRRLGVRTLFNCLGPLANPAGAAYQLLGVGRPDLFERWPEEQYADHARNNFEGVTFAMRTLEAWGAMIENDHRAYYTAGGRIWMMDLEPSEGKKKRLPGTGASKK